MQNHFADLEREVRRQMADPEIRTKVLNDLANKILRKMVEMHSYGRGPGMPGIYSPAPKSSVSFAGAIVKGVASVIADELSKHDKLKKPPSKT